MSTTFAPLGPPSAKKPRPKQHKFVDDLYGYTSCGEDLTEGTELYAWSEEHNDFLKVQTDTYVTENGVNISVIDGIIS